MKGNSRQQDHHRDIRHIYPDDPKSRWRNGLDKRKVLHEKRVNKPVVVCFFLVHKDGEVEEEVVRGGE